MTAPTSREGLLELAAHLDRIVRSNLGLASDKKAVSEAAAALRASVAQTSSKERDFCLWLDGYFLGVKGRDELTAFEANTIRANLHLTLHPTSPDSSTDQREGAK